MPAQRLTKPNRSLVDVRCFQRVPPSTVSRLLEAGVRSRMGLVASAPDNPALGEELWGGFIFSLFAVEGLCGEHDLPILLDLRLSDLAGLEAGQLAWRRTGGVWRLDVSWQTRLAGLLYRAYLARQGARAADALILPASLTGPGAELSAEQAFQRWLKHQVRAAGLLPLSFKGVREAVRLWQVRRRRGYVAAARQGLFLFDPPEPPRSVADYCALNEMKLPDTSTVLDALAAITMKGGAAWQPGLLWKT